MELTNFSGSKPEFLSNWMRKGSFASRYPGLEDEVLAKKGAGESFGLNLFLYRERILFLFLLSSSSSLSISVVVSVSEMRSVVSSLETAELD